MLTARIKIGENGTVQDTQAFGLIYLDSDKRVGPESKGFEATSYPEEEGEHIIPKTVDAAFDYTVKFFVQAPLGNLSNANAVIKAFNQQLYTQESIGGEKQYHQVEFYNLYKRHKIVGYPSEISEATEFWHDKSGWQSDVVVVNWKIRVTQPSLCDFSITTT